MNFNKICGKYIYIYTAKENGVFLLKKRFKNMFFCFGVLSEFNLPLCFGALRAV